MYTGTVTNAHIHRLLGLGCAYGMYLHHDAITIETTGKLPADELITDWHGLLAVAADLTSTLTSTTGDIGADGDAGGVGEHDYARALTIQADHIAARAAECGLGDKIAPIDAAVTARGGTARSATIYIDRELGPRLVRRYVIAASRPEVIADVIIGLNPRDRIHLVISGRGYGRVEENLDHDTPATTIAAAIAALIAVTVITPTGTPATTTAAVTT